MIQEDKELLLKDLCARLPYGVKCEVIARDIDGEMLFMRNGSHALELTVDNVKELVTNNMYEIKPYLFHLSSMTEEQKREYNLLRDFVPTYHYEYGDIVEDTELYDNWGSIDYLIANHFDYRELIEKGLAIDATDLNIY